MDVIVKTITRIMFPFILLFGLYVAFHGHLSPGGGFPAGSIMATAFTLLVIAFSEKEVEDKFAEITLLDIKSIASIALLLLITTEVSTRTALIDIQQYLTLWSGGTTLLLNVFGSTIVATGLIVVVYSLVKEEWKKR